jgi:large subunit ribosomal protein L23
MKTTDTNKNIFILKAPRITEKASMLMEKNVYAFDVSEDATKSEVRKAFVAMYKFKPVKIAMLKVQKKAVFIRGRKGVKSGGKKAYVYLKKGDKIEIA